MVKLVLTDIDNTLIPLGERLRPRTREAIHELMDTGVFFGPATGRDYVELMRLFRMDEACFMTGIFANGKRVRANGRYVQQLTIDHDLLVRIDAAIKNERDMFLVCYPLDTNLMNPAYAINAGRDELEIFERRVRFNGGAVTQVPDISFVSAAIACQGGEARMQRCRELIAEAVPEVDIVSPIPDWFDVLPKGTTKASGLDPLLEALDISLDEVLVFGDSENDLGILAKVPHSCAVANATDAVKKIARYRIGSVADDGVADALQEIIQANKAGHMPAFMQI